MGVLSSSQRVLTRAFPSFLAQDVIKTRIQKRDFKDKTSGMSILRDLVKNEGFGAFFKGLTPKLIVIGPKLVFSFTIAQQLMSFFERRF